MEARAAETLPDEPGRWQFEPKWDGFRFIAFKANSAVELKGKSGKPLGRYFPEVVETLRDLPFDRFIIDGELVIELNGRLTFDALLMRLHPAASRIRKLSKETPARLVLFDILIGPDGSDLTGRTLVDRRKVLDAFGRESAGAARLFVTNCTHNRSEAVAWLEDFGHDGLDGVIAKRLDGVYQRGQRAMVKVKRLRTADCVVGGFRYLSDTRQVGSLLLGLYDTEGRLHHVGFTSTIARSERPELTENLRALRAAPGFTGKAPGGPSRWSAERSSEWEASTNSRGGGALRSCHR